MKVTQFLGWDWIPGLEPSNTFFYADEIIAAEERRVWQMNNGLSALLLAGAAVLGVGLMALIELAPMLRLLA